MSKRLDAQRHHSDLPFALGWLGESDGTIHKVSANEKEEAGES